MMAPAFAFPMVQYTPRSFMIIMILLSQVTKALSIPMKPSIIYSTGLK